MQEDRDGVSPIKYKEKQPRYISLYLVQSFWSLDALALLCRPSSFAWLDASLVCCTKVDSGQV